MESYIMIFRDGVQYGPYTLAQVNQYLGSGELVPTDLAWPGHGDQWIPLTQLPGVSQQPQPVAETVRMPEMPVAETVRMPETPLAETVELPEETPKMPILETVRIPDADRPVYKSYNPEPTPTAPVQSEYEEEESRRGRRRRRRSTPLLFLLGFGWWVSFTIFFMVIFDFGGAFILGVIGSPMMRDHAARVVGGLTLLALVVALTLAIWLTMIGRLPGTRK